MRNFKEMVVLYQKLCGTFGSKVRGILLRLLIIFDPYSSYTERNIILSREVVRCEISYTSIKEILLKGNQKAF